MSKHTKGPWKVYATPNDVDFSHEVNGVASIYISNYSEANARLIAAAPELLEALKAMTHSLDLAELIHDDQRAAFQAGIAAIAKAEGQL